MSAKDSLFCARARRFLLIVSFAVCALALPAAAAEDPGRPEADQHGKTADAAQGRGRIRADLHGQTHERWAAALAAIHRSSGAPSASELAAAVESEPNPYLRCAILQALAGSDRAAALPVLLRALRSDPERRVRNAAAHELGRLDDPRAARALLAVLAHDADIGMRRACAVALAHHASTETAKALVAAAADPDAGLRLAAGLALNRQPKSPETDRALDRLENDADEAVRRRVHAWRQSRRSQP